MKGISAPELPVLHRLAIVCLMLPVVVWLAGWFEWWLGIPVAALLVCALRRPLSGSWRPRAPSAAEVAALAVAAGVVMMTAAASRSEGKHPAATPREPSSKPSWCSTRSYGRRRGNPGKPCVTFSVPSNRKLPDTQCSANRTTFSAAPVNDACYCWMPCPGTCLPPGNSIGSCAASGSAASLSTSSQEIATILNRIRSSRPAIVTT